MRDRLTERPREPSYRFLARTRRTVLDPMDRLTIYAGALSEIFQRPPSLATERFQYLTDVRHARSIAALINRKSHRRR